MGKKSILAREASVSLTEKAQVEQQKDLNDQQAVINKDRDKTKDANSRFKREVTTFREEQRLSAKEKGRFKVERIEFDRQSRKCDNLILEYQKKLNDLDTRQIEVINNLDKSKELNNTLDTKIGENNLLKKQLEALQDVNKKLQEELDDKITEASDKVKELDMAILAAQEEEVAFTLKIKQQEEMDNEIEVKRLRVIKLARNKGVAEELKRLEKELDKK